ncbi:MAG: hypothetical protein J6S21_00725, partial [Victivallales bacterium]|nr:hypothetical protein [Victivallales bacterium]
VDADDLFAGTMVEGRWDGDPIWSLGDPEIGSAGHITLDCQSILTKGLRGILAEVEDSCRRVDDREAREFLESARRCSDAIRLYCARYADAAEAAGKTEMARALRIVPYEPAYDFYSALQSVWMTQFVCSALIGARDFAIGRIDRWLLPYCTGSRDKMVEMLAFFFMKFNEVKGTTTHDYQCKPIPCYASNQYLVLGPVFNRVSEMVVDAAAIVRLPQPIVNFRLRDDFALAGKAAHLLDSQANFFNDKVITRKLLNSGFTPETAADYAFTACNRVDLPGVLPNFMEWIDTFFDSTSWFCRAMHEARNPDELLSRMKEIGVQEILEHIRATELINDRPHRFTLESLFNRRCIQTCRSLRCGGGNAVRWKHCMFSGIATMTDSLNALRALVKRMPYGDILKILDADFAGHEALRQEILTAFPNDGNGLPEADAAAAEIGNLLIDAAEEACRQTGFLAMPSFYSLTHHPIYGGRLGATPDGRRAGEMISENQSPVQGADRNGPTALLRSAAALPHHRCISGGLNMKFTVKLTPEQLAATLKTYFSMGGLHLGFTTVQRETLEEAQKHPEKHKDLLVRITGFSEYFVNISPAAQQEVINRTEY